MIQNNSALQPLAVAVVAVASLLSSYEALASQPESLRPLFAAAPQRGVTPSLKAVGSEHQKALKSLSRCIAMFTEINKHAISKGFPKHMLMEDEARQLAIILFQVRTLESKTKAAAIPHGMEARHAELRRALAEARSEVAATFSLMQQYRGTPREFEGKTDLEALKVLAEKSTDRLLEMARA
ncbi:hypothetical protein [Pseudomonas syringae]|uniref:Uncharacterized protein n=1 Tax=Pseudomonas syringae CC1417 TaxID=1357272 RepID=A0AAU8LDT7_PSESX